MQELRLCLAALISGLFSTMILAAPMPVTLEPSAAEVVQVTAQGTQAIDIGSALEPATTLRVGPGGQAALKLSGARVVDISGGSELFLHSADPGVLRARLSSGAVSVDTRAQPGAKASDLRMNVGEMRLRIAAAQAWVSATAEGAQVCVVSGVVEAQIQNLAHRLDLPGQCLRRHGIESQWTMVPAQVMAERVAATRQSLLAAATPVTPAVSHQAPVASGPSPVPASASSMLPTPAPEPTTASPANQAASTAGKAVADAKPTADAVQIAPSPVVMPATVVAPAPIIPPVADAAVTTPLPAMTQDVAPAAPPAKAKPVAPEPAVPSVQAVNPKAPSTAAEGVPPVASPGEPVRAAVVTGPAAAPEPKSDSGSAATPILPAVADVPVVAPAAVLPTAPAPAQAKAVAAADAPIVAINMPSEAAVPVPVPVPVVPPPNQTAHNAESLDAKELAWRRGLVAALSEGAEPAAEPVGQEPSAAVTSVVEPVNVVSIEPANTPAQEAGVDDGRRWSVVLASWEDAETAEKEAARFQALGLDAVAREYRVGARHGFRVGLGRYASRDEADAALATLKTQRPELAAWVARY